MDTLLLLAVLAVNILISIWNCYVVGATWKDRMAFGNMFEKGLLWSGVIQSGVGFSMPLILILAWVFTYLGTVLGDEPALTLEQAQQFMEWIFSLWYVLIIFPILGSGLIIWGHSVQMAYKYRDFNSIVTASWNTYAQINNTVSAVRHLGGALGSVGDLIGSLGSGSRSSSRSKGNGGLAILAIIIVVLALIGGFMIAFALIRYFASRTTSQLDQALRATKR